MRKKDDKDQGFSFPIEPQDIGPILGGLIMFAMTIGLIYFFFLRPSPFDTWFAMLRAQDEKQAHAQIKPGHGMMPAESVSATPAQGGQSVSGAQAAAGVDADVPAVPQGTESPETPESPAASGADVPQKAPEKAK